ncbi:MAG TPA: phosphoribosylanthranilate isomerase [Gammaproteobacteria bacterium]|nr:phosphoribosylanthranilate isomerase [Gammaproteobacteria bacterium]
MQRTRVKICGITRPEDGLEAARLGADAIGLVFHDASPRAVTAEQARAVVAALPPFVTTVGLFVDADPARIRAVLEAVPLDLLQFHGDEPAAACDAFGRPYIKALRRREDLDAAAAIAAYPDARGVLLDAYRPDAAGGTGHRFDWSRVPREPAKPVVLAGGLNPDNVGGAVAAVRPFAVDVSSGVERDKGIKDPARMAAFLAAVRAADGDTGR